MSVAMGHHFINKFFFPNQQASLNPLNTSERSWDKLQTNEMDHLMNTTNKSTLLEGSVSAAHNLSENTKGITLAFNISPKFFHVLSMNNDTKRCFSYLFDSMNGLGFDNYKFDSRTSNIPIETTPEVAISYTRSNGKKSSVIRLNLYSDKCICKKCLLATYFLQGTQATDLRNEFLRILSSEHCRTWNNDWIVVIVEQSSIFFCCFKNGVIYERLLESASMCAKMLLIKSHVKHLLEFKYSYLFFHTNISNNIASQKNYVSESKRATNVFSSMSFCSTGKEEKELVDGVRVVSFKTEADMNEYTNLEIRYLQEIKPSSPLCFGDDLNEIFPTKTHDITKIKGWRNKLFTPLRHPDSFQWNVNTEQSLAINALKKEEKPLWKYNEKKANDSLENRISETDIIYKDVEKREDVKEAVRDDIFRTNKIDENSQNKVGNFNNIQYGPITELEEKKYFAQNEDEKQYNGDDISVDEAFPSSEFGQEQLSFDCDLIMEITKHSESEKKASNDNVFQSDVLNEFLKNSKLNVSYDIPMLRATEKLSEHRVPSKQNNNYALELQFVKLRAEIKKQNKLVLKNKFPLKVTEPNDEGGITKVKFTDRNKKEQNNPTLRYIWVYGRPIEIVNGEREEEMKKSENEERRSFTVASENHPKVVQFDALSSEKSDLLKITRIDTNESHNKKPRLLSNLSGDEEVGSTEKKLVPLISYKPSSIPVIHGCSVLNADTNHLECHCKNFSLCMVLTIGKGRHLPKEAVENIEALAMKDNSINERMATVAACAFSSDASKKINRVIVPVVSGTLVNAVKNWEEKLICDKVTRNLPSPTRSCDVDQEVKDVLNDIVDYTVRKLDPIQIMYDDPFFEHPLSHVSDSNKSQDSESSCGNDFCNKGCVCSSLNSTINFPLHCGKISCLFECTCANKKFYEQNVIRADLGETSLSKEGRCQTVNKSELGDDLEINNFVDKSKREKKLPTRFRNNVLLGKEMCPPIAPSTASPKVIVSAPELPLYFEEGKFWYKGYSQKKQTMNRRLGFCAGMINEKQSLADVFIWCGIHDRYNCLCIASIGKLNQNAFIWKSGKNIRYLTHKHMMAMELTEDVSVEIALYDTLRFSARTYGAPIEYAVRNRTEIFKAKRKCELDNGIISCTNSYAKMKFFMVKNKDQQENFLKTEAIPKGIFKSLTVENIYIEPVYSYDEEIEVCDYEAPVVVERVLIEPDVENENDEVVEDISNEIIVARKSTSKAERLNKDSLFQKIIVKQRSRKEFMPESPLKAILNQPIKSYTKINRLLTSSHEQEDPEFSLPSVSVEINEKRKKFSNHYLTLNYRGQKQNVSDLEKIISKKKKISLYQDGPSKPLGLSFKGKIDPDLENTLIKLEDHPLKNQIYGPDNLPNLALLCLTPGIGYLPIIEFHQDILAVQDPVFPEIFHSFKNLDSANLWLNRFLKNRIIFESIDTSLKWVVVKPGIIKLKGCSPFCPSVLENPSLIVTSNGSLINRKKTVQGSIQRVASKIVPLSVKGCLTQEIENTDYKRKIAHLPKDTIVDIYDGEGKRRKIQLETLPVSRELILKRPVHILRNCSPFKVQESTINAQLSARTSDSTFTHNVVNNSMPLIRISEAKKNYSAKQYVIPPSVKSSIKSFIVAGHKRVPLRFQINPSCSLSPINNTSVRKLLPSPSSLSNNINTSSLNSTSRPLNEAKIVSHGRPLVIHNKRIIPINLKER